MEGDNMSINQRIATIISKLFGNVQSKFVSKTGVSQPIVSSIVNKNTYVKKGNIDKILVSIPSISIEWLLFGKGDMICDDNGMAWNEYYKDEYIAARISCVMKEYNVHSIKELSQVLSISDQLLGNYLNGKLNMNIEFITKISNAFPDVSFYWLYCGKGSMLSSDYNENNEEIDTISQPLYDIDFIGGFTDTFDSTENVDGKVCVPGYDNVTCWCRLSGDSMSPIIKNGDMIALKRTNVDEIQYGLTYAVVMENIRTVKKLRKSQNEGMLRFVPTNPEYDEQEFPIKSIKVIYQVVGVISRL